jgi:hypothetical protein
MNAKVTPDKEHHHGRRARVISRAAGVRVA